MEISATKHEVQNPDQLPQVPPDVEQKSHVDPVIQEAQPDVVSSPPEVPVPSNTEKSSVLSSPEPGTKDPDATKKSSDSKRPEGSRRPVNYRGPNTYRTTYSAKALYESSMAAKKYPPVKLVLDKEARDVDKEKGWIKEHLPSKLRRDEGVGVIAVSKLTAGLETGDHEKAKATWENLIETGKKVYQVNLGNEVFYDIMD